jgi:benzoyl-CoA reductase/2-hydroxyglutaryl-CoA dehydratase subunit BcrC/BadD/HgdB
MLVEPSLSMLVEPAMPETAAPNTFVGIMNEMHSIWSDVKLISTRLTALKGMTLKLQKECVRQMDIQCAKTDNVTLNFKRERESSEDKIQELERRLEEKVEEQKTKKTKVSETPLAPEVPIVKSKQDLLDRLDVRYAWVKANVCATCLRANEELVMDCGVQISDDQAARIAASRKAVVLESYARTCTACSQNGCRKTGKAIRRGFE